MLGKIAERKRKRRIVAVSMSEVWNKSTNQTALSLERSLAICPLVYH